MKFQTSEWQPEQLDRLIDHELTEAEEALFLEQTELHGEWRAVALALLEHRLLERVFQQTPSMTLPAASPPAALSVIPQTLTTPVTSSISVHRKTLKKPRRANIPGWSQGVLVAALLVMAFSGGWWSSQSLSGSRQDLRMAAQPANSTFVGKNPTSPAGNTPQPVVVAPFEEDQADSTVTTTIDAFPQARDQLPRPGEVQIMFADDVELARPVSVPVIEASNMENVFAMTADQRESQEKLTRQLKEALAPHNAEVIQQDQWIEVSLEDGRRGLMPVRDLMVVAKQPLP